jgi:hypothetical protein
MSKVCGSMHNKGSNVPISSIYDFFSKTFENFYRSSIYSNNSASIAIPRDFSSKKIKIKYSVFQELNPFYDTSIKYKQAKNKTEKEFLNDLIKFFKNKSSNLFISMNNGMYHFEILPKEEYKQLIKNEKIKNKLSAFN